LTTLSTRSGDPVIMTDEKPAVFTMPAEEAAASFMAPEGDALPVMCKEPGCTNTIEKPARGRTPLYCEEHKPTSHKAGGGTTARSGNGGWAKAPEVERVLTSLIGYLGAGLTLLNAEDGAIVAEGGPAVVHELIELGKTDRKIRKYLEQIAAPGKYGPLMFALMGIAVPIAANHGLLPKLTINLGTKKGVS
jgi:hypothetical protein